MKQIGAEKEKTMFIDSKKFVAISGTGNHDIDSHILKWINKAGHCDIKFLHLDMDMFGDNEEDFNIQKNLMIKNKHVLLFQSVYSTELLQQCLQLSWSSKFQYGAKSIIGVLPFMRYRRQDNEKKIDEINRCRWFIHNMKANGITRLVLCDAHNPRAILKYCKEVGIKYWNANPTSAFAELINVRLELAIKSGRKFYVYSPDEGSIERAISLAGALNKMVGLNIVKVAITFKERCHEGDTKIINNNEQLKRLQKKFSDIEIVFADKRLRGASVCTREDEVSTGGTAKLTGQNLKNDLGVYESFFCSTHPVCSPQWKRKFVDFSPYDDILFGDTIPRDYSKATGGKITKVYMSNVIAPELFKIISEIE